MKWKGRPTALIEDRRGKKSAFSHAGKMNYAAKQDMVVARVAAKKKYQKVKAAQPKGRTGKKK